MTQEEICERVLCGKNAPDLVLEQCLRCKDLHYLICGKTGGCEPFRLWVGSE